MHHRDQWRHCYSDDIHDDDDDWTYLLKSLIELSFIKMHLAMVVSLQWLVQEHSEQRAICDILSSEFPQVGCPLDTIHWIVKRQTATVGNGPGQDRARVRTDASETNGSWT